LKGKRDKELDLKRRASGMIDTLGRAFVRTGQHLGMTSVKEHEQAPNGLASSDGVQESPSAVTGKRKWKLEKRLGDGAFSAVWLAEAVDDIGSPISSKSSSAVAAVKIQVALKLLPRHLTSTNERTHISFLREVEVLSSIRHPNVVGFVDDFETPGYYALALETAEGGELFECVQSKAWASLVRPTRNVQDADRRRSIGEGLVKRILRELCAAVGFLHAVGIVHRDIKLESEFHSLTAS
jgi:tRNA (cytidine32/guanosine34-2'-O)-methyltransferase